MFLAMQLGQLSFKFKHLVGSHVNARIAQYPGHFFKQAGTLRSVL